MHFSLATVALSSLALVQSIMGTPIQSRSPAPNKYHLKTKVVDSQPGSGTNKDGLYLFSYHTGAGLGVGGLSNTKPNNSYTYTGADKQQFFHFDNSETDWPLKVQTYGPYQSWVPVSISISESAPAGQGFEWDGTNGLVFNNTNNGWLACDWWHSAPELFLLQSGFTTVHPSSCSIVQLFSETA